MRVILWRVSQRGRSSKGWNTLGLLKATRAEESINGDRVFRSVRGLSEASIDTGDMM